MIERALYEERTLVRVLGMRDGEIAFRFLEDVGADAVGSGGGSRSARHLARGDRVAPRFRTPFEWNLAI